MKKLFTLLVFLITLIISAQAPQGFNYQATVRNNAGALMINKNVTFKFNVMKDTPTSVPVFSETHYVPTDDLGAVNLVIGKGTATTGTFATIDWATGTYYLGIELNTGNDFVAMGTTQLLSVPYALYASNSGSATIPNLASVLAKNNSANNTKITNLADPTDAQDAATKRYVDANAKSFMNFNGFDNYQIWNDNTTFQLQPNSFLFLNANNTTLVFPNNTSNFGDVIYVYVMQKELPNVNLKTNGPALIAVPDNSAPNDLYSTSSGIITGKFKGGLNTIVQVGDYWMVGDFAKTGIFPSVAIGSQIWSTTNLDITTYRDGTPIPQVTDPSAWANLTTGAWCYYNNDPANGAVYGKLYNWYAVNDPRGLAPEGWHIPSDGEWTTLTTFLDPPLLSSGLKMKEIGTSHWINPHTETTNESGFTGLPGGIRGYLGDFTSIGSMGIWWSTTTEPVPESFTSAYNNYQGAWGRNLKNSNIGTSKNYSIKLAGLSVRCIKD